MAQYLDGTSFVPPQPPTRRFFAYRLNVEWPNLILVVKDEKENILHRIDMANLWELVTMRGYTDEQWIQWFNSKGIQVI